jgi:hypothetical protein
MVLQDLLDKDLVVAAVRRDMLETGARAAQTVILAHLVQAAALVVVVTLAITNPALVAVA